MTVQYVSGVAALVLNTPVEVDDKSNNRKWNPDEVKSKLCTLAIDLREPSIDNSYGGGLVNVYNTILINLSQLFLLLPYLSHIFLINHPLNLIQRMYLEGQ